MPKNFKQTKILIESEILAFFIDNEKIDSKGVVCWKIELKCSCLN